MMRPFDPFSAASASSRDDALSASWKAGKEDHTIASSAYSQSSNSGRSSQPYKPYRHFQENDDVPFDQRASASVVQESVPSFDEGFTDMETSSGDADRAAASQLTSFDEERPSRADAAVPNGPLASYSNNSETTDESVPGTTQRPEPRSTRRSVEHVSPPREAPPPNQRASPRRSLHDRYLREAAEEQEHLSVGNSPIPTGHQIPAGLWNVPPTDEDPEVSSWRHTEESEMDYHTQSFEDYGISNPHANKATKAPANIVYDSFENIEDQSSKMSSLTPATGITEAKKPKKPRSILKRRTVASDAEESALVTSDDEEFKRKKKELTKPKSARKQGSSSRPRHFRNQKHQELSKESEDDTSLEVYGVPRRSGNSVKHRTQEAFGKRGKRAKSPPQNHNERGVSFEKRDQVHRYEQEEDNDTHMTGYTGTTGTGSVTSAYSKSMESEVEDLVRDFLFIGEAHATQPGARRSRSASKRQPQQVHPYEETTIGSSTLDTNDEDLTLNTLDDDLQFGDESTYEQSTIESTVTSTPGDTVTRTTVTGASQDDDPLLSMWSLVQGSLTAFTAALGIAGTTDEKPAPKKNGTAGAAQQTNSRSMGNDQDQVNETPLSSMGKEEELDGSHTSTLADMIDMASDFILSSSGSNCNASPVAVADASDDRSRKSLEDDGRLAELALYAARSKHEIHGIVFDESTEVDIVTEVKFSVVKVLLPMGILFQENAGGCWVTKVFASGNAAMRAKGGTVEIGDQLAAINGTSAIEMKVDRICSMVAEVPKGSEVELTFLRYTGPMRPSPGTVQEEGYEVRDPDMDRQRRPIGLLSSRKKSGWMSSRKKNQIKHEVPTDEQSIPPQKEKKRFRLFGRKKGSYQ